MSHSLRPVVAALALTFAFSVQAAKPAKQPAKAQEPAAPVSADFELAHNLGPVGEQRLQAVVDRFNKEQGGNLKLSRLEKGEKPAGLNLLRRYDASEALANPKAFLPLHEVMAKNGQALSTTDIPAELKAGVSDAKGRLVALPVVYSTPVLFYNKNALRKAKLDPEQPPKTWFEMQGMLDKLQDAGYQCPYTSSWPVWVHVDNVSTISGLPATTDKGQLVFNGLPQVKHVAMMASWTRARYLHVFNQQSEAEQRFASGECAVIAAPSASWTDYRRAGKVDVAVSKLPYYDDFPGAPQNTIADGPALWASAGKKPAEYKAVARFVSFWLQPDNQVAWQRETGYLPLNRAGLLASRSELLGHDLENVQVAVDQLASKPATPQSSAQPVVDREKVRRILDEELAGVWADQKAAKEALDNAVTRARNGN